ncbi:hypothetical protein ACMFMG_011992 [Clarireedia jacksonii]
MRSEQYTLWLEPYLRDKEVALQKSGRLGDILSQTHGEPSLILFVGKSFKSKALRHLATPLRFKQSGRHYGEIHLRLDAGAQSTQSNRPLLFADGPIPDLENNIKDTDKCPELEMVSQNLPWARDDLNVALSNIYTNLLSPFTDVVCLFLSDFGGLASITHFIALWLDSFSNHSISPGCYPRLLIVVEDSPTIKSDKYWETRWKTQLARSLRKKTIRSLNQAFSHVSVHRLLINEQVREEFRYLPLKDYLLNESDAIRAARIDQQIHFVGKHFNAFFEYAYKHFIQNTGQHFNFIEASRLSNPVSSDFKRHLLNFFKKFETAEEINEFVLPVVASCIMLDSFPPGMHGFDPVETFRTLYKSSWKRATEVLPRATRANILSLEEFIGKQYLTKFVPGSQDFKQCHKQMISSFQNKWKDLYVDSTCLMCLCRRPEYSLPCGHFFCGIDIQRFGVAVDTDPHRFIVHSCFLCSQTTHEAQFRFKPKTKGVNVLGIDGGGVRGVIPLQSLLLLEQKLKPYLLDFPIQDLFDVAFGTSSGGLIVMAMYLNGLSVTECMDIFETLSFKAFDRGFVSSNSIFSRLRELLISYFADSLYSADNLEEGLRSQFGDERSLMDHSAATRKGAKVGITVTGVPNAELLFTNYNGVGSRLSEAGYRHILSDDTSNRVRIWEAYFTPYHIAGVGEFQDGGLWRNNPIDIAMSEARALWPTIDEPDVVLSLGTGYQVDEDVKMSDISPTETSPLVSSPVNTTDLDQTERAIATALQNVQQPRGLWRSGFITRCLESFLSTMDGQKFYDLPNQWNRAAADDKKRYFRLNVQLQGKTPALDDVSTMSSLKSETMKQHIRSKSLDELAECLISTLFYFELTSRPIRDRSHINCQGQILCIIGSSERENDTLQVLLDRLTQNGSKFYIAHRPLSRPINDLANIDPVTKGFRLKVELRVRDLDSIIPISIRLGKATRSIIEGRSISASPFTINGLLKAQGWDSPFGRADHGPTEPDDIRTLALERKRRSSKIMKRHSKAQVTNTSKRQRRRKFENGNNRSAR